MQREVKRAKTIPVVVLVGVKGKTHQVNLSNEQGARVLEFIMNCFDNNGRLPVHETPYENVEIYFKADEGPELISSNEKE